MAKAKSSDGINRSEEIRLVLKQNPKLTSKEVVASLGQRGIAVKPALVYMIKSKLKSDKQRHRRQRVQAAGKSMGIADPVALILKVRSLAHEAGGIRSLKQVVDAMAE